ncbi:MAG: hypothetical protein O3B13_08455 [Planctomycetota bacterium]|nr:hypothetical protein [Planctomycetota bacterium]MDA1163118.1 hypothetical protein [Planctomycetota bacterium]
MSRSDGAKVIWKCPECFRNFRIPKSKPRPSACVHCAKKGTSVASTAAPDSDDGDDMFFREAEPTTSTSLKFASTPVPSAIQNPQVPRGESSSNTSVEALSDRLDEVLQHLEGITRTMTLVRRVMWGIGLATLLSMVATGVGLLYSMSLISSLGDLPGNPDGGIAGEQGQGQALPGVDGRGDARIPPQMQQNMQQIEEYSRTVNELLKEVNQ